MNPMLTKRHLNYLRKRKLKKFLPIVMGILLVIPLVFAGLCYFTGGPGFASLLLGIALVFAWPWTFPLVRFVFTLLFNSFSNLTDVELKSCGLYLRPFSTDSSDFEVNYFTQSLSTATGLSPALFRAYSNFDCFAARAFRHTPYHLISIGDPREILPSRGTLKIYPSNQCWKLFVLRLIRTSRFVLIRCLDTPGFRWELLTMIHHLHTTAVFLYIGQEDNEQAVWPLAHKTLEDAGFKIPPQFPGRGALISFSPQGDAYLCSLNIAGPAAFSRALLKQLDRKQNQPSTILQTT